MTKGEAMVPTFLERSLRYLIVLGVLAAPLTAARPSFAQG